MENVIIATISGSIITLLGILINNRHQLRISKETNRFNFKIEELRISAGVRREYVSESFSNLEEAHRILSKLSREFSLTVSYITASNGLSPEKYHNRYLKFCEDLDRLKSIIDINFSELSFFSGKLVGLTNCFWGIQQNRLYKNQKGDTKTSNSMLPEIIKTSKEIGKNVDDLKSHMMIIAESLSNSLGINREEWKEINKC